jgi:hypothetical protein
MSQCTREQRAVVRPRCPTRPVLAPPQVLRTVI